MFAQTMKNCVGEIGRGRKKNKTTNKNAYKRTYDPYAGIALRWKWSGGAVD